METYALIFVAIGIGLGILYIFKAVYEAENDPESFEHIKKETKFRRPAEWKDGVMPEDGKKKLQSSVLRVSLSGNYHEFFKN